MRNIRAVEWEEVGAKDRELLGPGTFLFKALSAENGLPYCSIQLIANIDSNCIHLYLSQPPSFTIFQSSHSTKIVKKS